MPASVLGFPWFTPRTELLRAETRRWRSVHGPLKPRLTVTGSGHTRAAAVGAPSTVEDRSLSRDRVFTIRGARAPGYEVTGLVRSDDQAFFVWSAAAMVAQNGGETGKEPIALLR